MGGEERINLDALAEEILFLEAQLIEVKKLPFLRVNPKDASQQKATPAAKLYKELLQQYNNSLRLWCRYNIKDVDEEDSPLRAWAKAREEALHDLDSGQ